MDGGIDFEDRQPLPGHFPVRLNIPDNLPERFRRPAEYILTAVNKQQFEFLHAFSHEHCIVFIAADQTLAARIRQFTSELLATMAQTTKVFRLRVKGVAALSKPLVAELASCLGELIEVKMNGNTVDNYADTALISVRQAVDWQFPSTLHFRAYGLNFEAKLALATDGPPGRTFSEVAHRAQSHEAKHNVPAGADAGWRVVGRKPKVTKLECCRDFARGTCTRGDKCAFRHAKEACRDAARGRCTRQKCMFDHASKSDALALAASAPEGHPEQRRGGAPAPAAALELLQAPPGAPRSQAASGPSSSSSTSPSSSSAAAAEAAAAAAAAEASSSPSSPSFSSPSSSRSSPSSPPSTASTSPAPRRRRHWSRNSSDVDQDSSPPGSPADSPRPSPSRSRSRSRSCPPVSHNSRSSAGARRRPRSPCPQPGSPREDWTKPPSVSPPGQPLKKKSNTRSSKPSSPAMTLPAPTPEATSSRAEERGPQQTQAAPLEGAGPAAL